MVDFEVSLARVRTCAGCDSLCLVARSAVENCESLCMRRYRADVKGTCYGHAVQEQVASIDVIVGYQNCTGDNDITI